MTQAYLSGTGGTKHAVIGNAAGRSSGANDAMTSRTLDDVVTGANLQNKVRLCKSDVDGFDFDVIDSADATLERDAPILFFECHYTNGEL